MLNYYYKLEGRETVPISFEDLDKNYADVFNKDNRIVKQEFVGDFWVSTVFLVIDHAHNGGKPLLFETMVFDNCNIVWDSFIKGYHTEDVTQERYHTYDEAEKGHETLKLVYQTLYNVNKKERTRKRIKRSLRLRARQSRIAKEILRTSPQPVKTINCIGGWNRLWDRKRRRRLSLRNARSL